MMTKVCCRELSVFVRSTTKRPIESPSVFGNTDRLCFVQLLLTADRSVEVRTVTAESRAARENLGDKILCWNDVNQIL